ncbi:hypothetical protein C5688_20140 [Methylocystis sp. MitZ-2018]|nr:hypothetical protein C5688_20140 [Methylocystis sp. MitZ-2018]
MRASFREGEWGDERDAVASTAVNAPSSGEMRASLTIAPNDARGPEHDHEFPKDGARAKFIGPSGADVLSVDGRDLSPTRPAHERIGPPLRDPVSIASGRHL